MVKLRVEFEGKTSTLVKINEHPMRMRSVALHMRYEDRGCFVSLLLEELAYYLFVMQENKLSILVLFFVGVLF